ncbi:hypothetical protein [Aggregatilinea lenta]|uniref:hypothetical protein n=1 Tax=Aggregatilinea lenta TaxID=913108 RepID=UPI000E5A1692|nr:hypothetical protein [Aggregatilinea lenta]
MSKKSNQPIVTPEEAIPPVEQVPQMATPSIPEYTTIADAQGLIVKRARKVVLTRVVKMNHAFLCHTREGDVKGRAGDYLAFDTGGYAYPILASEFAAMYEIASG